MEGASLLQHAMGMTGDAFTLSTDVEEEEDEEGLEIVDRDEATIIEDKDLDSLDMDEEAQKYIDIVDSELPENVFDDENDENEDYDAWLKEQQKREWSIIYSKKPELIIDTDEYDKILVNLLMSY